ncbi:MAG: signal peptidase I [Desulfobulbaceae bacterium]|nr:signal peptidase I [Deltaproteobacteria bacterium]MDD3618565.1 signal peptidase I [Desulfobulbaceae bacterium]MDY0352295.1 signal peptidase I [Desulfobulbaceae bacterium]
MAKTQTGAKSTVREYAEAIIIALILALIIRTFIIQAFKIPSGSMLPTLQIGDHLLVNKFMYGFREPFTGTVIIPVKDVQRNDIIVFRFPRDPRLDYIKRVVAVGGDTVEGRDKVIYVNGEPYDDKYAVHLDSNTLNAGNSPRDNFGPVTVPESKVFVMGDNRDNSFDSRFWGFVDDKAILGKALIIYWSWDVEKPLLSFDRLQSIRWSRIGDLIH